MTCSDIAPLIAAAADERLDPARRALLDAHLADCASCRDALADQRSVVAALSALTPIDVAPSFALGLRARIDGDEGWFGLVDFRAWTLRLAPAAAALALLAYGWTGPADTTSSESVQTVETRLTGPFQPSSLSDWQGDVSANALLEAALKKPASDGDRNVR